MKSIFCKMYMHIKKCKGRENSLWKRNHLIIYFVCFCHYTLSLVNLHVTSKKHVFSHVFYNVLLYHRLTATSCADNDDSSRVRLDSVQSICKSNKLTFTYQPLKLQAGGRGPQFGLFMYSFSCVYKPQNVNTRVPASTVVFIRASDEERSEWWKEIESWDDSWRREHMWNIERKGQGMQAAAETSSKTSTHWEWVKLQENLR